MVACTSATTTAGARLAPPEQQIYRVNVGTEPSSYDPTQQVYSYEAAISRNVFEPLLKGKADLSDVQPAAAASYEVSSDGLTYTFHLQPNAKWSDGKPVTAQDWVYGYRHLLNPALAAGYVDPFFDTTIAGASGYGKVDVTSAKALDTYLSGLGLSAPDAHTFVVKLTHPAAYFKWVVTLWVAVPLRQGIVESAAGGPFASTDATKAEAWAQHLGTIIGNGPFKISEIVGKDHVTLVGNANYWGSAPKLRQIVFHFIADGSTALSQYQAGALDQINVPLADVSMVMNDPKLSAQAKLSPRLTSFWITFNTHEAPFDNPLVRLALAKSIDRNQLVNEVQHKIGAPASELIPKGMNGYDNSDLAQSFDVVAAKADLVQAGVTPSQLSQFKLLTRDTPGNKTINQFIVAQWNTNLGTNIQLDAIASKTVTADIRKGKFDIYGPDGWVADYPDQQDMMDIFEATACHSLNFGCPSLPGYDALVLKADSELDQTARNADYLTAQKQLVDSGAVVFLYQQQEYDLIAPYVGGLTVNPFDDQYVPGDQSYQNAYILAH
jgi:oligopeptide transport system substrate-binding protein